MREQQASRRSAGDLSGFSDEEIVAAEARCRDAIDGNIRRLQQLAVERERRKSGRIEPAAADPLSSGTARQD